jgi:hypothetical protein
MKHARCQACKAILLDGAVDPLDVYLAGGTWTVAKPEGGATVYKEGGWLALHSLRVWGLGGTCGKGSGTTKNAAAWIVIGLTWLDLAHVGVAAASMRICTVAYCAQCSPWQVLRIRRGPTYAIAQ